MYLGRECTRSDPLPIQIIEYTDSERDSLEEMVDRIKKDYPEFTDTQARIWEVLSRYRGDAGLSAYAVSYLASAIYTEIAGICD